MYEEFPRRKCGCCARDELNKCKEESRKLVQEEQVEVMCAARMNLSKLGEPDRHGVVSAFKRCPKSAFLGA